MIKDFDRYIEKTMADLKTEIDALHRWFKQDFPESQLVVNVDLNKIHRELTIQCRVLTGLELSPRNRVAFFNRLSIRERDLIDPLYMQPLLLVFNEQYRKVIALAINNHFHNEKAIASLLVEDQAS